MKPEIKGEAAGPDKRSGVEASVPTSKDADNEAAAPKVPVSTFFTARAP